MELLPGVADSAFSRRMQCRVGMLLREYTFLVRVCENDADVESLLAVRGIHDSEVYSGLSSLGQGCSMRWYVPGLMLLHLGMPNAARLAAFDSSA